MCEGHHEADCGCHHGGYGYGAHSHGHECRCQEGEFGRGFGRRFRSRDERVAELEAYLKDLEAEAQGVREALDELRGA